MHWRYAVRLAQHAATDAVLAPLSEAAARQSLGAALRAISAIPISRVAAALHYKLRDAARGRGQPIPQRTWDYEYAHGGWEVLDSPDGVAENMVIVGYVHRLWKAPRVLDLGCGSGTLADFMRLIPGASYTGVDLSIEAVSRAASRGLMNALFVQGAIEKWLPAETYDAIVFNESLYYVSEPSVVLRRYSPYLTDGGAFIISIWQSGTHGAMWDRIHRELAVVTSATVRPGSGVTRDIRVLRPREQHGPASRPT
jgi:SAM-dependent methyltransferase